MPWFDLNNGTESNSFQIIVNGVRTFFTILSGTSCPIIRTATNLFMGRYPIGCKEEVAIVPPYFRTLAQTMIQNYIAKVYKQNPGFPNQDASRLEPLNIRYIIPPTTSGNNIIYYMHGGGFFFGQPQNFYGPLSNIARNSQTRVASIEYRKVPENTVVASFIDSYAGYLYLTGDVGRGGIGLDPSQIIVSGDSAGSGLAGMIIHFLRNTYQKQPRAGLMWSANFDLTDSQPGQYIMGYKDILPIALTTPIVDKNLTIKVRLWVLPYHGATNEQRNRMAQDGSIFGPKYMTYWPMFSPMLDPDLSGLPPMLMMVGENDGFRDSSIVYGKRIFEAKNSYSNNLPQLTLQVYQGMPHDFPIVPLARFTDLSVERASNFVKLAFNSSTSNLPPYEIQNSITTSKFGPVPNLSNNRFECYYEDGYTAPKTFQPNYQVNPFQIWDWGSTNYYVNYTTLLQ